MPHLAHCNGPRRREQRNLHGPQSGPEPSLKNRSRGRRTTILPSPPLDDCQTVHGNLFRRNTLVDIRTGRDAFLAAANRIGFINEIRGETGPPSKPPAGSGWAVGSNKSLAVAVGAKTATTFSSANPLD